MTNVLQICQKHFSRINKNGFIEVTNIMCVSIKINIIQFTLYLHLPACRLSAGWLQMTVSADLLFSELKYKNKRIFLKILQY